MGTPDGRRAGLDGLRGLAALVVVVHHCLLVSPALADAVAGGAPAGTGSLTWWLSYTPLHLVWAGTEAVVVFFVLSGVVLAIPTRHARWRAFYPQRLARLYLPVVGAVVVATLLARLVPRDAAPGTSWWIGVHAVPTGLGDALHAAALVLPLNQVDTALWSLQWEVLFSLLLPAFLLLTRLPAEWVLVAIGVCGGLVAFGAPGGHPWALYLPMFAVGVLLAPRLPVLDRWLGRIRGVPRAVLLGVGVVLLLAPWWVRAARDAGEAAQVGVVASVAGAAVLVVLAGCTPEGARIAELPWVHWLGARSFSLYLVHEPVVVTVAYLFGGTPGAGLELVVALPLSLLLADGFFRVVEHPAHRLAAVAGRRAASART